MTRLIGIIVLLLAVIVGYMYFFGKADDKEKAHTIVNETKELGKSVGDFLKTQKEKYDDGEFDALIKRISNSIDKLSSKSEKPTNETQTDLRELERQLKEIDPEKLSEENRQKLKKVIEDLDKAIE